MAWKKVYKNKSYYYFNTRSGDQVWTVYAGSGEVAALIAWDQSRINHQREVRRARLDARLAAWRKQDEAVAEYYEYVEAVAAAALQAAGYHRHDRGPWRKRRAPRPAAKAESTPVPTERAPDPEAQTGRIPEETRPPRRPRRSGQRRRPSRPRVIRRPGVRRRRRPVPAELRPPRARPVPVRSARRAGAPAGRAARVPRVLGPPPRIVPVPRPGPEPPAPSSADGRVRTPTSPSTRGPPRAAGANDIVGTIDAGPGPTARIEGGAAGRGSGAVRGPPRDSDPSSPRPIDGLVGAGRLGAVRLTAIVTADKLPS